MQLSFPLNQPYENGTRLSGQERAKVSASIQRTNVAVLDVVRSMGGATAEEVHARIGGLLTSARRSLTDLMNAGMLVKDGKRMGRYGLMIYVYKINITMAKKAKVKSTGEVIKVYKLSGGNWYDFDNMGADQPPAALRAGKKEFKESELEFIK